MSNLILTWTQAFGAALAPSLFALALVWLRQHQINTRVIEAVGRAAGEAYTQMVQSGGGVNSVSLAAAVAEGRAYLLARIPDTLKAAGLAPEAAAQMVSAELGKLLAVDPTVGLGVPLVGDSRRIAAGTSLDRASASSAVVLSTAPAATA
jgi:hypothetical protein